MEKKKTSNRKRITKVLPDKIFFKLWTEAHKIDNVDDYINKFLRISSKDRIDFGKYDIDDFTARSMLENIHNSARISIGEIIKNSGLRKSQISYQFCIPIRTIEDWCAGKNKCAPYIKLMLLRYFNMITLGAHIVLESEDKRKNRYSNKDKPELGSNKVSKEEVEYYKEINRRRMELTRKMQEENNDPANIDWEKGRDLIGIKEQIHKPEQSEWDEWSEKEEQSETDEELDKIDELLASYDFSKYEKDHIHHGNSEVKNILESTDYLKDILK